MNRIRVATCVLLASIVAVWISGCSSGNAKITLALASGGFQAIDQGQTLTLTVTVNNDKSGKGVTFVLTSGPGAIAAGPNALTEIYTAPPNVAAPTQVTITVTSLADSSVSKQFVFTVTPPPSLGAGGQLADGTEGTAYGQTPAVTGGAGTLSWSIVANPGPQPAGLNINSSTGAITGTPTGPAGVATFTVKVTDSGNPAIAVSAQFSINVHNFPAPTISPSNLPNALQGSNYNQTVSVNGGHGPFNITKVGALPNPLIGTANAAAGTFVIMGTPTDANGTVANFTVKVTDSSNPPQNAQQALSITVQSPAPPQISTNSPLPTGANGTVYSGVKFAATLGVAPYSFAVTSGALPNGLNLAADGTLSGTPNDVVKTYNFSVTVTDHSNPAQMGTKAFQLTISAAPPVTINITQQPPATLAVNASANVTAHVANDPQNKGVDWTFTCGGGTCGTLNGAAAAHTASDAPVTFKAPAAVPPAAVVITATATADNTIFANANAVTITTSSNNDAKLNGDYVALFNAFDGGVPGAPVAIVFRFHADGNGGITNVAGDVNRTSGVGSLTPQAGDGYTVGSDNRGTLTVGGVKFSFVLDSSGNARLVEFDDSTGNGTRGSGIIKKQDLTAATLTAFSGDFGFGVFGEFPNSLLTDGHRIAMIGRFTSASGTGAFSSGSIDVSVPNASFNSPLTGHLNAITASTGRGTAQATITTVPSPPAPFNSLTMNFAAYVVSVSEAFWVQTDARGSNQVMVSGGVLKQSSSAYTLAGLQGTSVFEAIGVRFGSSSPAASVSVGEVTLDNTGTVTQGIFDQNEGGTLNLQVPIGGNVVLDATFKGRATFNFCPGVGCNSTNAKPEILYFVGQNKAFMLEGTAATPGDEVTFGFLEPQTGGPFTEASIAGTYAAGTITPAVSVDTNECGTVQLTSGAPSSFAGTEDFSEPVSPFLVPNEATAGTYTLANVAGSTGRFTAASTQPQAISFVAYALSQTKFLIVSVVNGDSTGQIAVFEQ